MCISQLQRHLALRREHHDGGRGDHRHLLSVHVIHKLLKVGRKRFSRTGLTERDQRRLKTGSDGRGERVEVRQQLSDAEACSPTVCMKGAAECHWQAEQDGAARARYGAGHAAGHAAQRATALADKARACCSFSHL